MGTDFLFLKAGTTLGSKLGFYSCRDTQFLSTLLSLCVCVCVYTKLNMRENVYIY